MELSADQCLLCVLVVQMFEGFASPASSGRISRVDLMESLGTYASDQVSLQRNERPATERRERGGRRRSMEEVEEAGEERKKALATLLDTIEWDADGYVDYAEFVRRNTGTKARPPTQPQPAEGG